MNNFLNDIKEQLRPEEDFLKELKKKVVSFTNDLAIELKKKKIRASISTGGSFAKNTMLKRSNYDIDILVRMSKNEDLSNLLGRALEPIARKRGFEVKRVHGSRDYFQIKIDEVMLEIIPVLDIKHPRYAENVTDLSYFHVSYVKKNIKGREDDVRLLKQFFHAAGVYGAESYIQGFSGYGVECLLLCYKTFTGFLKKATSEKLPIVLDPARHYKNKQEILISLNGNKIKGPVILVDPTFKERNVLAALSTEKFDIIREKAKKFLAKPSKEFFVEKELDIGKLDELAKRKHGKLVQINISTNRQAGDIAGTKMRKFSLFLTRAISEFKIERSEFVYNGEKEAKIFLVMIPKKDIIVRGPPIDMQDHVKAFKRGHYNLFEKDGRIWAREGLKDSPEKHIRKKLDSKILSDMDISKIDIEVLS